MSSPTESKTYHRAFLEKLRFEQLQSLIDRIEQGQLPVGEYYLQALGLRQEQQPKGNFLKLTPLIELAIRKAAELHANQPRKGNSQQKIPYISHLLGVAEILAQYTDDEVVLAAGVLHDAPEDHDYTNYTLEHLAEDFGDEIASIVKGVTENTALKFERGEKETWQERKDQYLEQLKAAPLGSHLVACADKIHNLRSLMADYQREGEAIWQNFNSPPEKKLCFYEQVLIILRQSTIDPALVAEFETTLQEAKGVFKIEQQVLEQNQI